MLKRKREEIHIPFTLTNQLDGKGKGTPPLFQRAMNRGQSPPPSPIPKKAKTDPDKKKTTNEPTYLVPAVNPSDTTYISSFLSTSSSLLSSMAEFSATLLPPPGSLSKKNDKHPSSSTSSSSSLSSIKASIELKKKSSARKQYPDLWYVIEQSRWKRPNVNYLSLADVARTQVNPQKLTNKKNQSLELERISDFYDEILEMLHHDSGTTMMLMEKLTFIIGEPLYDIEMTHKIAIDVDEEEEKPLEPELNPKFITTTEKYICIAGNYEKDAVLPESYYEIAIYQRSDRKYIGSSGTMTFKNWSSFDDSIFFVQNTFQILNFDPSSATSSTFCTCDKGFLIDIKAFSGQLMVIYKKYASTLSGIVIFSIAEKKELQHICNEFKWIKPSTSEEKESEHHEPQEVKEIYTPCLIEASMFKLFVADTETNKIYVYKKTEGIFKEDTIWTYEAKITQMQVFGLYLFILHEAENKIDVIDIRDGTLIHTIAVHRPRCISFDKATGYMLVGNWPLGGSCKVTAMM